MRRAAKAIAERGLLAGARVAGGRRTRGRGLILAWHNVVPDGSGPAGDGSLHLPQSQFARQLELVASLADVVPLPDLLEAPSSSRPRVALTWDDAYRGAVELGIREVAARGLPATMFVAPGILGGRTLWWDAIADGALDPSRRRQALEAGAGDSDAVRDLARAAGWPWRDMAPFLTTADGPALLAAAAVPGITLGAHSWSHPNLVAVPDDRLGGELARSREWITVNAPAALNWLAYPYGLHDGRVCRAAQEAGFVAAVAIEGGWMSSTTDDPWRVPRFNVPAGLSLSGLELRLRGWLA